MPARCCIVLMTREVATVKMATHASSTRIANWNESCWKNKKKRILQRTCALRLWMCVWLWTRPYVMKRARYMELTLAVK